MKKTVASRGSGKASRGRGAPPRIVASACGVLVLGGCATVATIESVDDHSARVYSGTRLDVAAVTGAPRHDGTFRTSPPPYPLLDLPFSFVLDTLMLPLTLGVSVTFGR